MQQRNSFVCWMELVERELLTERGVALGEVIQFVPPTSLFYLWQHGEKSARVADLIATRTLFCTTQELQT